MLISSGVAAEDNFYCLAQNIYFEARSESTAGKIAVGFTTLNRVHDKRWPSTICTVVWQPNQFSWTHDGLSDEPTNYSAWTEAQYLATVALELYAVKDSNHYHNNTVFPGWAEKNFEESYLGFLNKHLFYDIKK